ncbi:hypothetical protein HK405_010155, partial [Cladochytrium tenue]
MAQEFRPARFISSRTHLASSAFRSVPRWFIDPDAHDPDPDADANLPIINLAALPAALRHPSVQTYGAVSHRADDDDEVESDVIRAAVAGATVRDCTLVDFKHDVKLERAHGAPGVASLLHRPPGIPESLNSIAADDEAVVLVDDSADGVAAGAGAHTPRFTARHPAFLASAHGIRQPASPLSHRRGGAPFGLSTTCLPDPPSSAAAAVDLTSPVPPSEVGSDDDDDGGLANKLFPPAEGAQESVDGLLEVLTDGAEDKGEEQAIIQELVEENGGNGTPVGLRELLKEHQVFGLAWMIKMERDTLGGGILADDMGLGK